MNGIEERVLALGGMLQALAQVRRIADTGQSESIPVQVALDSVFRIDAADAEAVYGEAAASAGLRPRPNAWAARTRTWSRASAACTRTRSAP
jgi:high frequency lysogenization protein